MPVPSDDTLCRFVPGDDKKWSAFNDRPRPPAFKGNNGISVWHVESLHRHGVVPEELRIKGLHGHGQAHLTTGDYLEKAQEAEQETGIPIPLSVVVEWRTEDQYVQEPWRKWAYAHVQVEHSEDNEAACVLFRQLLSKSARHVVPPDRFKQAS